MEDNAATQKSRAKLIKETCELVHQKIVEQHRVRQILQQISGGSFKSYCAIKNEAELFERFLDRRLADSQIEKSLERVMNFCISSAVQFGWQGSLTQAT
jgi:hypothetical protein